MEFTSRNNYDYAPAILTPPPYPRTLLRLLPNPPPPGYLSRNDNAIIIQSAHRLLITKRKKH
jgi:hypothetical protein